VTFARSCATVVASTELSTVACAVETESRCCWTVSCCCETARSALAIVSRSVLHEVVAVVKVCTRPELVPFAFFATTR